MVWRATALTLFPEAFPGPLAAGVVGAAEGLARGLWTLEALDIRSFAGDKRRTVDDAPYGGGPGMVLRPDVAAAAVDAALAGEGAGRPVLHPSPRGRPMTQRRAEELAHGPGVVLLCGRYEGIDARAIEARGIEEVCVGDFVVSGGELPAMAIIEAAARLLPGVLGNSESAREESFAGGLLEHPHYTRPAVWEGREVPSELVSGDHGQIAAWRRRKAEEATRKRRPDLWERRQEDHAPGGRGERSGDGDHESAADH